MDKNSIIFGFQQLCEQNGYKPKQEQTYKAQYWYLAGVRLAMLPEPLPPYIEIIHMSGRSLLDEK
jgi:hypothetical protein